MSRSHTLGLWLDALHAADTVEAAHQTRMRELLSLTDEPFSNLQYRPGHFTASAFIVSPQHDAMLLIFHSKLKRWLQPGGHVEAHDADLLASARREVQEEVGLTQLPLLRDGIFDLDVHAIPARGEAPAHEHFDVRFAFVGDTRAAHFGDEAQTARWVKLDEIANLESDESVMRAVRKLQTSTR